jgi:ribosomal protein S27E
MECPFCAGEVPAHVKKCKHCGEWLTKPDGHRSAADERETCSSCGKKMIPRIITGPPLIHGQGGWTPVPKKSICPFCGATHKTFPASLGEKIGLTIFGVIFLIFVLLFFAH